MKKRTTTNSFLLRTVGGLMLAGCALVPMARAESVEDRLAAMEARIRQLETELAVAKTAFPAPVFREVAAPASAAFIRKAVMVSPAPAAMAAAAPAPQAELSGDLEGLNFFKGVKFGGFLDAYYGFNMNKPTDGKNTYRNFDFEHNSITLAQADLEIMKPVSESAPLGYMLQMGIGPTANAVNGGDFAIGNSTAAHFFQYYLSGRIPTERGVTVDVGKFVTQHGAEVIDTRVNPNYSRGLLFAWAIPYYHFGVRLTAPVADTLTLGINLTNGWNNVIDNNGGKTVGFMLNWAPTSKFSFIQNYMVGPEQAGNSDDIRHMFDSLLTVKLHDKITFMSNFDYGKDVTGGDNVHWIGTANYLKFQVNDKFAFTPRFEYFYDVDGFMTGTRQQLKSLTLTPEVVLSNNLVTRFEFRRDWSTADTFGLGPDSDPNDAFSQETVAVGLLLKF